MAIYTKTGDKGQTSLASGQRVSKNDTRIEAYGTVDELNSWIGLLCSGLQSPSAYVEQLHWIQNKLFNLGAALSEAPGEWITDTDVQQLEHWIDTMQQQVPPQRAFILPAGAEIVCRCHICRTVCRRAERRMIDAKASPTHLQFVNRLSDYLFVLARHIGYTQNDPEMVWNKE
jgi:cob(I)alamin adenosyltransferase